MTIKHLACSKDVDSGVGVFPKGVRKTGPLFKIHIQSQDNVPNSMSG